MSVKTFKIELYLEKQQSKSEQYNRCNNVEISGISNEVSDQNLEEIVIGICKDYKIDVNSLDIEGCRKLRFSVKRTLSRKVRYLLAIDFVPIISFSWGEVKELRRKG